MNSTFIHERTIPVPIKTISSYDQLNEHSLNHNIIDPSKICHINCVSGSTISTELDSSPEISKSSDIPVLTGSGRLVLA